MGGLYTTGLQENGIDIGTFLVEKSYLMDMYPSLVDWQKAPGLWLWGRNDYGQLGDGTSTLKSSPVQTIAGGTNWKQVSAGSEHIAAIKTDGTLWLWGSNDPGQLGNGIDTTSRSSPVQTIASGTNWKQVSVGGGVSGFWGGHTAAIKTDGTLWLWGRNYGGRLGDNTTTNQSSPVQTIASGTNWKQVSCGFMHTAAIKTDGSLWLWGTGDQGQRGDNTGGFNNQRSSPVQTICSGTNWKQVSAGGRHTAAIKTDGSLWLWGYNSAGGYGPKTGHLGDNTTTDRSSPVQTIASGTNWKQVSCGYMHTAAIKTDGSLWLWGYNGGSGYSGDVAGQLGDNTQNNRSSPVQTICSGTNWKQVSCGRYNTVAIKTDGTLWNWGYNNYGQLGDNTIMTKSSPVQTICSGTNWKQVAAGFYNIVAIKESDEF